MSTRDGQASKNIKELVLKEVYSRITWKIVMTSFELNVSTMANLKTIHPSPFKNFLFWQKLP